MKAVKQAKVLVVVKLGDTPAVLGVLALMMGAAPTEVPLVSSLDADHLDNAGCVDGIFIVKDTQDSSLRIG